MAHTENQPGDGQDQRPVTEVAPSAPAPVEERNLGALLASDANQVLVNGIPAAAAYVAGRLHGHHKAHQASQANDSPSAGASPPPADKSE
jgi:hypothetical protein